MIAKTELVRLLNIIDSAYEYTDGGKGYIHQRFTVMDLGTENDDSLSVKSAWRWFNHMREVKRSLNVTRGLNEPIPITLGDLIKSKDTSYHAVVTGEAKCGHGIPVWKVCGPRGETSIILKSQAEFIAPDWEGDITGVSLKRQDKRVETGNRTEGYCSRGYGQHRTPKGNNPHAKI